MNIVFVSPNFLPLKGGLENVMRDWAFGLVEEGHHVLVITFTPNTEVDDFPFQVERNIGFVRTWNLMRKADVVIQFNVSLKAILPCLLSLRPFIVSHHSTNISVKGEWNRYGRIKQSIADRFARVNIGCSKYVAKFSHNSYVIYSPYNDSVFFRNTTIGKDRDLIFVGRLVSDKGCDVLLKALAILGEEYNLSPSLSIVGNGPERLHLEDLIVQLKVKGKITFYGSMEAPAIAVLLNQHTIMVVPSTWDEPFGIVALEGLACGCAMVVSNSGGLPEATGPFSHLFHPSDAHDLARVLAQLLMNREMPDPKLLEQHLNQFKIKETVKELVQVLNTVQ